MPLNIKEVQDRTYELLCLVDDICREEQNNQHLDEEDRYRDGAEKEKKGGVKQWRWS